MVSPLKRMTKERGPHQSSLAERTVDVHPEFDPGPDLTIYTEVLMGDSGRTKALLSRDVLFVEFEVLQPSFDEACGFFWNEGDGHGVSGDCIGLEEA